MMHVLRMEKCICMIRPQLIGGATAVQNEHLPACCHSHQLGLCWLGMELQDAVHLTDAGTMWCQIHHRCPCPTCIDAYDLAACCLLLGWSRTALVMSPQALRLAWLGVKSAAPAACNWP